MNPWTIIGWAVLVIGVPWGGYYALRAAFRAACVVYLAFREMKNAAGVARQAWSLGWRRQTVLDTGRKRWINASGEVVAEERRGIAGSAFWYHRSPASHDLFLLGTNGEEIEALRAAMKAPSVASPENKA